VHAVLIGADLPDVRVGRSVRDMPVLARDKVRFIGEKVAAVAAESAAIAEAAVQLVDVEYEELPAIFDPLEAMQPGAPLIHTAEEVRSRLAPKQVVPDYPNGVSAPAWGASAQQVQQALAAAERVFEHTFRTPIQHQAFLEPHACIVELDQQDVAHIWAANKAPFLLLDYLRNGLGLQREQVEIHILPLGGDFGGKGSFMDIPLAYFLAKATRRPVKMVMTFAEEFMAGNPRHSATVVVRSGVNAGGRVVARWMQVYFNSGAYAAFKPALDGTLPSIEFGGFGAYDVPVSRLEAHMIYTNTVPCGHMRGPGEVQTGYALECHTELVARELGIDPVAFRLANAATTRPLGTNDGTTTPARVQAVLEAASRAIDLHQPRPAGVGRGLALIEYKTIPGIYSAGLRLCRDGQVTLLTPIVENGVGSHTAFQKIVAEELELPLERVSVSSSMENISHDRGVGGARVTRLVGKVVTLLAARIRERLRELLAAELGCSADQVRLLPAGFETPDGRFHSLSQAAALAPEDLVEHLRYDATTADDSVVLMAQAAEVQLDPETGQIRPLRLASVHEVGRIIMPALHRAQIEGGLLQGLGFALMEGLTLDEGRVTTLNLNDYKIPTVADLPPLEIILLSPDPGLGITPIGEGPSTGIAPALANAVVDVLGPHPLDLPLLAERLRGLVSQR
jgi:CO/xanthine dehydrogenase Mo-binding subunit